MIWLWKGSARSGRKRRWQSRIWNFYKNSRVSRRDDPPARPGGSRRDEKLSLEELRRENTQCYQDILPENYPTSYASPDYAAKMLGEELGVLLSFLYTELRGMIVYAWEQKEWDFLVGLELFLQVYSEFEGGEVPTRENVRKILYWYVNDYCQEW